MNVLKGGWHPGGGKGDSSGSASSTTGVRGKLSELKGKATGKPVDRHDYDAARSHQSAPLSSLRDPASFAPPPKHSAYYGDGAQSPAVTRTVTSSSVAAANKPAPSLGAPLVETGYAARRAAEQRERQEQAELEAAKPKGPYRSDTSGLRTDNLPPPPVKRVTANVSGGNGPTPSPARRASPALPPRVPPRQAAPPPSLPPRQNEYPDEHTPAPPPAYQEAISQPTTQTPSAPVAPPRQAGMINQFAANRLGQAGVNVSGFGIGGETSSTANGSAANPAQPARDYRSQIGQMGALHQRYQNSNANNTSAGSSQAAGGYGQQVGELQQRFSKMNTGNSNAPSSSSHAQTAQNAFSGIAAAVQKKPPPPPPKKSGLAAPPQPASASPSAGLAPPPLPLGKRHLVLHVSWTYQSRLSRTKEQPVWISADQISYMPPNPTIVIVPETWCPPSLYDPLTLRLERAGYRVRTVFLPSTGDKILAKWGTEDVDIIAATIRHCVNRGEDIVVVAHGAGAASAGDAVSGLSKADRVEQGKRGGVIRMVYIAGILTDVGQSLSDLVGARDWVTDHGTWDVPDPARIPAIFGDDIENLDVASILKPSAKSTRTKKCDYAAWRHIACSYLICESDGVAPLALQEEMAALPGPRCDVETIDAGHLPFLSRPSFAVGFIRRAVGQKL
ncbi:unnamed protein product [Zymoseptoria tritici ST99CH_1A5]|uniref:AB hydrolase-1 domain-containing protein n=1 Tax=Zymoseptoria tritici ST99CH_1A5 TaxID=1276529 RepID=A0A1Y6LD33_ZYMTR|nr:unnamed protein product [Zymoseptoria tritici ST99CH_1A5]